MRELKTKWQNFSSKEFVRINTTDTEDDQGDYWTEHDNIDMCGQGDVEIIHKWSSKYSIQDLKRIVEEKGYSAISLSKNNKSFDFAAFKKFDYQLTPKHCKPSNGYKNTLYILNRGDKNCHKEHAKKKTDATVKRQEQPIDVEFINGGIWTAYKNIDMCGQGDVEIIGEWEHKYSIEELKRKVENKGYSALCVSPNSTSFGHAALKKFNYNLTPLQCKPTPYECIIYIWNSFGSDSKNPALGHQLKLVKRGSPQQAIFEDIDQLKKGKVASAKLSSHGGNVSLGKQYNQERRFHEWRYIESQCVGEDDNDALCLQYVDNNFVKLVNMDLVFDVAFWKMDEGNVVNYVGAGEGHVKTKQGGGGRDWTLNDDGTISAKHHPHLVLGF